MGTTGLIAATTAERAGRSVPSSGATPSPKEKSDFSTPLTLDETETALLSGLENTEPGWKQDDRKAAYEAGMKRGAVSYFSSKAMEQLSMELTVLRVTVGAMTGAAEQTERLLSHWKAEARFWKEQHDKVHDEYCATISELARKYVK